MSKDMSVYFFHVRRGDVIYLDHEGADLPDLRTAWERALADAKLLLRPDRDEPHSERWIEIDDDFGNVVSTPPEGTVFQ